MTTESMAGTIPKCRRSKVTWRRVVLVDSMQLRSNSASTPVRHPLFRSLHRPSYARDGSNRWARVPVSHLFLAGPVSGKNPEYWGSQKASCGKYSRGKGGKVLYPCRHGLQPITGLQELIQAAVTSRNAS